MFQLGLNRQNNNNSWNLKNLLCSFWISALKKLFFYTFAILEKWKKKRLLKYYLPFIVTIGLFKNLWKSLSVINIYLFQKRMKQGLALYCIDVRSCRKRNFFYYYYEVLFWTLQELSPTSDTALVKSLMNLMDSLMEEFQDEAKITQMEDREIMSWLEVSQSVRII